MVTRAALRAVIRDDRAGPQASGQKFDGASRVLRVWTTGTLRIAPGVRRWRQGAPSKYQLAFELLRSARHRLRCRPEEVLLDAWEPSAAFLKRPHGRGWDLVCRLKKTRRANGEVRRADRRHPSWAATGRLTGGVTVLALRDGAESYA